MPNVRSARGRAASAILAAFALVTAAGDACAEQFTAAPTREVGPYIAGQISPSPVGGWQQSDDRTLDAAVNGQGGWQSITFPSRYDEEIATGTAHSGGHSWRISNWFHTGLVNPILSPQFTPVGESTATNADAGGGPAQSNHVVAEFWFRSAAPDDAHPDPGSAISSAISDAPGNRMTYLGLFDDAAAPGNGCPGDGACFHVDAVEVVSGNDAAGDGDGTFVDHYSPPLTRGEWYRARIDATFVDGPGNITTDPALCPASTICHTGNDQIRYQIFDANGNVVFDTGSIGSWEAVYYDGRYGNPVGTVVASDYVGFRVSGNPDGGGQTPYDTNSVTNRPHGDYLDDMSVVPDVGSGFSTSFEFDRYVATSGSDTGDCSVQASPCQTIAYAIGQANPYDTIHIAAGTYAENLVVDKSLAIIGAGQGATIVVPANFNPDCSAGGGGGSLCGGGSVPASVVFLVQASDVDISNLSVDGINPNIAGHPSDIAARDGIMTDYTTNVAYTGFNVHDTTVQNIYLRGIYAPATNGRFEFRNNTVANIKSDPASVAIFNSTGGGIIDGNHVSGANDAISANHSEGTTFTNNVITNSASGIHTDNNNDGAGGTPDVIAGNSVNCGVVDGYGIWTFVPYKDVSIHDNSVTGCTIGLGAFGGRFDAQPLAISTFAHNRVDATGALVSATPGDVTIGAYLSTTTFYFGDTDNGVVLTANTLTGFDEGVFTERTGSPQKSLTTTASFNRIVGNGAGWVDGAGPGVSTFVDNWWGCNGGPGAGGCDSSSNAAAANPWLVLQASANPSSIGPGGTSQIAADLTHDSASALVGTAFPDGTAIAFNATRGSIPASADTTSGQAQADLTGLNSGWSTVHVQIDNAVVKLIVGVTPAAAFATVNDDSLGTNPDPDATCPTPDFNTITDAINTVPAGTKVLVCSGDYPENVVVDKNGIALKGAFAGTAGDDVARGTASEAIIDPATGIALRVLANNAGFDGFTIQNVADTAIASGGNYGGLSDTVSILDNRVLHVTTGSGLYTNGPRNTPVTNWTVSNNLFSDIHPLPNDAPVGSGINLWAVTGATISNNVVTDSAFAGIQVNGGTNVVITGNTIGNTAHNGINIALSSGVQVSGNTVTDANTSGTTDEAGLTLYGGTSDVAFYCNAVSGSGTNGFSTASAITDPFSGISVFDNSLVVGSDISHNLAQPIAIGSNWYGGSAPTVNGSDAAGVQVAGALASSPIGNPACGDNTATGVVAVSGTPQTAVVNSAFGQSLVARAVDALGGAVPGAPITFTPPASGASAALSPTSGSGDYDGAVSVAATANSLTGTYAVVAATGAASANFVLTNSGQPSVSLALNGASTTVAGTATAGYTAQLSNTGSALSENVLVDFVLSRAGGLASGDVTLEYDTGSGYAVIALSACGSDLCGSFGPPATGFPVAADYNATTDLRFTSIRAGAITLLASVDGVTSHTAYTTSSETVDVLAAAAAQIAANSATTLSGTAGTAESPLPSVRVSDAFGNPVAGYAVNFAPGANAGSVSGTAPFTDANGVATLGGWTLGTAASESVQASGSTSLAGAPLTFTATVSSSFDLAVNFPTIDQGYVQYGKTLDYTIVVSNAGPSTASNLVTDTLPAEFVGGSGSWICYADTAGANCGAASGTGDLADTPTIPSGGSVTYVLSATVSALAANDTILDQASVADTGDANTGNNTASWATQIVIFRDGFETGGDGANAAAAAMQPAATLDAQATLTLDPATAPRPGNAPETWIRAVDSLGREAFRIELLPAGKALLLRLVSGGANGAEMHSAWVPAQAFALGLAGSDGRYDVLAASRTGTLQAALPPGSELPLRISIAQ